MPRCPWPPLDPSCCLVQDWLYNELKQVGRPTLVQRVCRDSELACWPLVLCLFPPPHGQPFPPGPASHAKRNHGTHVAAADGQGRRRQRPHYSVLHGKQHRSLLRKRHRAPRATRLSHTRAHAAPCPAQAYPRHALQSSEISAVTQIRASDDYVPSPVGPKQWRLGSSSILAHALALAPFKVRLPLP